jgi:6-phosphofructokinase 1
MGQCGGQRVLRSFIDYILPLTMGETTLETEDGLPRFAVLKKRMTRDIE